MVVYYIERINKMDASQDIIKLNVRLRSEIPLSTETHWYRIYTLKELARYLWDKGYHFYGWEHFKTKYWDQLSSSYKKRIMANLEATYKNRAFNKTMHLLEVGI